MQVILGELSTVMRIDILQKRYAVYIIFGDVNSWIAAYQVFQIYYKNSERKISISIVTKNIVNSVSSLDVIVFTLDL